MISPVLPHDGRRRRGHLPLGTDTLAGWIVAAAFLLGLALPLASLPWFRLGYWDRAEPLVIGLHLCAGLAALGLGLAALRSGGAVAAAWRSPVVVAAVALGGVSLAVAPWVPMPALSVLGAPQSGQGAAWSLELGLLTAAARFLRAHGPWRTTQRAAVVAVAATAALKGWDWWREGQGGDPLLIWVAAYYAWAGLALPVLVEDAAKGWRRLGWGAAVAVLLVGRSAAAGGAAALAVGLVAVAVRRPWGRGAAVALPVAALVAAPALLLAVPGLGAVASLADRRSLLAMVGAALGSWSPGAWATGVGWGRTQDVFQANLASSGQVLWDGSWIFMSSDYFHTHSALAEALLAAGLPGLVLTAAWFAAVAGGAAPGKRALAVAFATALAVMSSLWFQLALSLPVTALALAALAPPLAPADGPRPPARRLAGAALGVAVAALCFALALRLYAHGRALDGVRADLLGAVAAPRPFPDDPHGGDLAAAELIRDAFWRLENAASPAERAQALPAARAMAEHLARRIPETPTLLLPVTGLSLLAQIKLVGGLGWLDGPLADAADRWPGWLDRALFLAPARGDLAIPYLTCLAVGGRTEDLRGWTGRLLAGDPHDPVGLYFHGVVLVQVPDPVVKRRGLEALRGSVAAGVERFMPLDAGLRGLLE